MMVPQMWGTPPGVSHYFKAASAPIAAGHTADQSFAEEVDAGVVRIRQPLAPEIIQDTPSHLCSSGRRHRGGSMCGSVTSHRGSHRPLYTPAVRVMSVPCTVRLPPWDASACWLSVSGGEPPPLRPLAKECAR